MFVWGRLAVASSALISSFGSLPSSLDWKINKQTGKLLVKVFHNVYLKINTTVHTPVYQIVHLYSIKPCTMNTALYIFNIKNIKIHALLYFSQLNSWFELCTFYYNLVYIWNKKSHPLKVILLQPLPRLYHTLRCDPLLPNKSWMASDRAG